MMKPHYEQWAQEFEGKAFLVKVDPDENSETPQQQGVTGFPTYKFFKNGQCLDTIVGANKDGIYAKIMEFVNAFEAFTGASTSLGSVSGVGGAVDTSNTSGVP